MRLIDIEGYCSKDERGCWRWNRYVRPDGYVRVVDGYEHKYLHRVVWSLVNGPIPPGGNVVHMCGVRHCMNPKHLELCSRSEQLKLAARRGGVGYKLSRSYFTTPANRARGKLDMPRANQIREEVCNGEKKSVVARKYGVTVRTVTCIVEYKLWVPDILLRAMGR